MNLTTSILIAWTTYLIAVAGPVVLMGVMLP